MDDAERLVFVRAELRFELGLLHERVNALLTAEAFLTIAYVAAPGPCVRRNGAACCSSGRSRGSSRWCGQP